MEVSFFTMPFLVATVITPKQNGVVVFHSIPEVYLDVVLVTPHAGLVFALVTVRVVKERCEILKINPILRVSPKV